MRSGDLVIDGSLSTRLERIAYELTAITNSFLERTHMAIKATEISDLIKQRIENFKSVTEARNVGTIVSVTDGICRIHGLADARYGEMLEFPGNTFGLALNLEQDSVGAVVLGDYKHLDGRRHRQDHGPHPRSAGGPGTARPRGRCARQPDRRQGPDQCQAAPRPSSAWRRASSIASP